MAFYGHLFLMPGQQGDEPAPFMPEEEVFAEALALEWLQHAAERATKEKIRQSGARELAFVKHEMGVEQSMGRYARSAANSLAKISWFWPYGFGFAERFINRALAQVTRCLTQDDIRAAALKSVTDLIGPETRVIIGHSLGSVVAFEAAHFLQQPLPLLVTLGSPLGLQNIVYQRLRPQPPAERFSAPSEMVNPFLCVDPIRGWTVGRSSEHVKTQRASELSDPIFGSRKARFARITGIDQYTESVHFSRRTRVCLF
jgi:pimeloyl-ACP methyl ester carboxylesterase